MKHFTITVKVAYDETTVPPDMKDQLEGNVQRCVDRGILFDDSRKEVIVDDWNVEVEES